MNFNFSPIIAADALARMKRAPDGAVALGPKDWQQGAIGTLLNAELLAARAGLVPYVQIGEEQGIVNVGAARQKLEHAPPGVAEVYLACHGAVRKTHARMAAAAEVTPELPGGLVSTSTGPRDLRGILEDPELGAIPLAFVVIAVVGLAASIAAAAYVLTSRVEVDGRNLRTTSEAATLAQLAREQLEKTGRIDPGIYEAFKELARAEATHDVMPWALLAGGAGLVAGGALAWKFAHRKGAT